MTKIAEYPPGKTCAYTPGPWIMEQAQDVVTDAQHRVIAIAYDPADQRAISETSNANAKLICAAPDLLNALKIDTNKYVDVTSPDNIVIQGHLENGAIVNAYVGAQPYHGSGHRLEIYGKDGTLAMIGGGEGGEERRRKVMGGHKDDKALQELPVPERFTWVPEAVRSGPAYDVGQMWVKFAEAIRTNSKIEPDFEHAVRRHRTAAARSLC